MPRPPLRSDSTNGLLPAARGLEPAYDWKNWRTPAQRLISLYTDADRVKAAEVEAEAKTLVTEKDGKQRLLAEALEALEKFDTTLREPLRAAFETLRTSARRKRNCLWIIQREHHSRRLPIQSKAADDLKAMDAKIAEARARRWKISSRRLPKFPAKRR